MLWRARKRGIRNIRHDRIFELNETKVLQYRVLMNVMINIDEGWNRDRKR